MRNLTLEDLRAIVHDPSELAKGARALDDGALSSLARSGDRLYADAQGGMVMPYKVTITIGDAGVRAQCTCMAARTRPFCKHAAALLVAWANAPDAFVESDRPPADRAPKRRMKTGKADAKAMMAAGIARVITLVRELAATGVASVAEGRGRTLEQLAEGLRADRLRRLAGRVARLGQIVSAVEDDGELAVSVEDYADLVCDLLLTARKVERHLGGEALDPRHVEELIGKTWRKTDREPVEGLDLVEYSRVEVETSEKFVIREARFIDVVSGTHYADKQILPGFLARRTAARPSRAGEVLRGAFGSVFPGYGPRRLDLANPGDVGPLGEDTLRAIPARSIAEALAAFQEHRRDVFAPGFLPVTVRVDAILARSGGLLALDGTHALTLPADDFTTDQLAAALRDARPRAILGDLVLVGALPVLVPRALVLDHALISLVVPEERAAIPAPVGAAATSIAELRAEVAALLAQGLSSFTARAAAPLAARLRELSLARPAEIIDAIPAKPEAERLEDVVRILQVLGVALVRLIGAIEVDRDDLIAVPTHPGVLIPRVGAVDRWRAAVHLAVALDDVPTETLVRDVHPWWAYAALSAQVAARVASHPSAIEQARAVLAARSGRAAQRTAIRVLCAADLDAAPKHIALLLGRDGDRALGAFALDQIDALRARTGDVEALAHRRGRRVIAGDLARILTDAGAADDRARAALALAECGDEAAAGPLRLAFVSDTAKVREAAAVALGRLCDPDALDRFIALLPEKPAALALGESGDARAIAALVDALAAGARPALLAESLRAAGRGVAAPLRAAVERDPALGKKKPVKDLLAELGSPA